MKLEHFNYIRVIHETGSLNKSAAKLFISQPYLSAVIIDLERELGCQLIKRSNRGVVLTDAGESFLKHAIEIQTHIDAINELGSVNRSNIYTFRVVGFTSYLLLDVYHEFVNSNACKDCIVEYVEFQNPMIFQHVLSGTCELGLMYVDTGQLPIYSKFFRKNGLQFIPFYTGPLYAIVSGFHPLAKEMSLSKSELIKYPLLIESFKLNDAPIKEIDNILENDFSGFHFEKNQFDNNRSLLYYLAKSSTAFSLGQYPFNKTNPLVENGELIYIPISDLSTSLTTGYLFKENQQNKVLIDAYIDMVKIKLGKIGGQASKHMK